MTTVEVLDADITRLEVDAIANAANTDLKHAAADLVGRLNGGVAALAEDAPEHEIVDRRPARVGALDVYVIEIGPHRREFNCGRPPPP